MIFELMRKSFLLEEACSEMSEAEVIVTFPSGCAMLEFGISIVLRYFSVVFPFF